MVSTRNSQQQQQQGRSAKLIEPKVETVTQPVPIPPKPIPFNPIPANYEHLQMAQSQNSYQQQVPNPLQFQFQSQTQPKSKEMKILLDLINRSTMPVRRRRRKSRRQRKVRNHLEESANLWPNQLTHKSSQPIKSSLKPTIIEKSGFSNGNVNANDIAYAINLSENNKNSFKKNISNSSKHLNDFKVESKSYKIWSPVKAENVLEAPFATSTSAGQTRMIIISSSRTISTSTDRTGNADKPYSTKHRKESLKERPTHSPHKQSSSGAAKSDDRDDIHWKNKYNIDYDNKLEDEYEIIMKDE